MKYGIIGNSTAGINAIEEIKKNDPQGEITVFSMEPEISYSRPLISSVVSQGFSSKDIYYRDDDFYKGVELQTNTRVVKIFGEDKRVLLSTGEERSFDRLLIATGSSLFIPPISGLLDNEYFTLIDINGARKLRAGAFDVQNGVVIGGGLIGLKAAESLKKLGINVSILDMAPKILGSILNNHNSRIVLKYLENAGVKFFLNTKVAEIKREDSYRVVCLEDGESIKTDLIVVAAGGKPNINFAHEPKLNINRGIVVDEYLETSIHGVYSAGDVAEASLLFSSKKDVIATLPNAAVQGKIAGQNMSGNTTIFEGSFPYNSINIFGMDVITLGNTINDDLTYEEEFYDNNGYRSLFLENGVLKGAVLINNIQGAGILGRLIKKRVRVSPFIESLLSPEISLIELPEKLWKETLKA